MHRPSTRITTVLVLIAAALLAMAVPSAAQRGGATGSTVQLSGGIPPMFEAMVDCTDVRAKVAFDDPLGWDSKLIVEATIYRQPYYQVVTQTLEHELHAEWGSLWRVRPPHDWINQGEVGLYVITARRPGGGPVAQINVIPMWGAEGLTAAGPPPGGVTPDCMVTVV